MPQPRLASVLLTILVVACSGDRLGQSGSAINNGITDIDIGFRNASATFGSCTGTLITPIHLLTANHCIIGSTGCGNCGPGPGVNASLNVSFGLATGSITSILNTTPTQPRTFSPVDFGKDSSKALDMAIVTLSSAPPIGTAAGQVKPVHPWETNMVCPPNNGQKWNSLFSGYGGSTTRLFNTSSETKCDSDLCRITWQKISGYFGPVPGDSGGPLFLLTGQAIPFLVCGVDSGTFDDGIKRDAFWAETSFNNNDQFIKNIAWDFKHNTWWGDCSGADTDSDGFPDPCDNCKAVANVNQADSDGDGVGDVCDNCPSTPTSNQGNSNPEGESETGTPAAGDVCDLNSLSAVVSTGTDYGPKASNRCVSCVVLPGDGCVGNGHQGTCDECNVSRGNRLMEDSFNGNLVYAKQFGLVPPDALPVQPEPDECAV